MTLLGTIVPLALVIGLSPLPVLPLVALLTSGRGLRPVGAFVAAWLVVLTLLTAAAALLASAAVGQTGYEAGSEQIGWAQVITGVVFLGLAAFKVIGRLRKPGPPPPPPWLDKVAGYGPRQAAVLGAGLAGANPKNIAMAVAAGAELALFVGTAGAVVGGVVLFVAVASIGVLTPVLITVVLGERAGPVLQRVRQFLERRLTAISVVILTVLGVSMVSAGLAGA